VKKYGTTRHGTGRNIMKQLRFACWLYKAIDTQKEQVTTSPRQQ